MQIILIACSSQKRSVAAPARDLYTSALFTKSLAYARALVAHVPAPSGKLASRDELIFVMSAQHGLVALDRVLTPYDRKLSSLRKVERMWWGIRLVDDLVYHLARLGLVSEGKLDASVDNVVLLGGQEYTVPVRSAMARKAWRYIEPLAGLQVGQRLAWLNAHTPAILPPSPDPLDTMMIGKRIDPPVFKPQLPYVKQSSSTIHGWTIEIFDPTVSELHAVKTFHSVKKWTHMQKHQALQNYRYVKENNNA